MKIRDKFYKQMIKTKSKQQKLSKHTSYKKYRNKITELLRIRKQTSYCIRKIGKIPREFGKIYMKLYLPGRVKKTVVHQP